jgi:glutathione synthase/RimK-type ligase-like ATP-grasp enzyme
MNLCDSPGATVQVAFLTYSLQPNGAEDDQLAFPNLRALGHTIHTPVWNDPTVNWRAFDAVIVRSCWDYYKNTEAFRAWLDRMEAEQVRLLNPVDVIRWNMDKFYLREMAANGAPVIPAVWLKQGETADLAAILAEQGWLEAVVKPTISAGAYQTWTVTPENAAARQPDFDAMVAKVGVIVQKFLPEIATLGEWSFHFFNNQFSHAIIKTPNPGDFRIQGGRVDPVTPSAALLAQAQQIMAETGRELLYARVDGIVLDDQLHLMELELIEPRLYLKWGEGAPQRFAEAIHAALTR